MPRHESTAASRYTRQLLAAGWPSLPVPRPFACFTVLDYTPFRSGKTNKQAERGGAEVMSARYR